MGKTICFAASSGGHYAQLVKMRPLMDKCNAFIVTEDVDNLKEEQGIMTYKLKQINRKEIGFIPKFISNYRKSKKIIDKEKPDAIVTTGVLAIIPLCMIAKKKHIKIIYIESFAKTTTPTKTGKFMYKRADEFYVQWESMLKVYPDAKYLGGLY